MRRARDVNEYIAAAPKELQGKLKEIRKAILDVAPEATEKISYCMPYYSYKGRLAYFLLAKKHIGLYVPTPVMEEHKKDLKEYETAKATVRFPLDKKIPIQLVKKLIRARVKRNEEK